MTEQPTNPSSEPEVDSTDPDGGDVEQPEDEFPELTDPSTLPPDQGDAGNV